MVYNHDIVLNNQELFLRDLCLNTRCFLLQVNSPLKREVNLAALSIYFK